MFWHGRKLWKRVMGIWTGITNGYVEYLTRDYGFLVNLTECVGFFVLRNMMATGDNL